MSVEGPRGCAPEEVPAVVELADRIFVGAEAEMGANFPTLFSAENSDWLRTFWDDGRPVAHVGVWRGEIISSAGRLRVAHIGAVCTLPEYRTRGLATVLLEDAFARLAAEGVSLVFISGGRGLYLRMGARPAGRIIRYTLTRPAAEAGIEVVDAQALRDDELEGIRRLYEAEAVRYLRSAEEWGALLPGKGYIPPARGRGLLLVRHHGRLVAYLLLGRPRLREGLPAKQVIEEFAGDRQAVVGALGHVLELRGGTEVELEVQPEDVLRRYLPGAKPQIVRHMGTIRLLNLDALWDTVGPRRPDLMALRHEPAYHPDAGAEGLGNLVLAVLGAGEDSTDGPDPIAIPRPDGMQYI